MTEVVRYPGRVSPAVPEPSASAVHGQRGGVWWANPLSPVLLLVLPTAIASWLIPAHIYREFWKTPKYFEFPALFRSVLAMFVLSIGALVATRGRLGLAARATWPALSPVARRVLGRAFPWCYRLTILGYVLWLGFAVSRGLRPADFLDALRSQNTFGGSLKRAFATVSGVTTLTQLGVAVSVIGALLRDEADRAVTRGVRVVFALALVRGFFLSERLAIIEVVLPWLVIRSARLAATRRRRTGRFLVRLAPVLAIPTLLLVFSLFEYSRSWSYAKTRTDATFLEYSTYRIAGYYATSYNNGELYRITTDRRDRLPFDTVEFVWSAPGVSTFADYESVVGQPPRPDSLKRFANPEFNSPGGLSGPFIDFGDVGGILYFLGLGVVLGFLYRAFAGSQLIGLLLYPVFFVGLLELPRYMYWAQGRATLPFVALLLLGWRVSSIARRVRERAADAAYA